MRQSATIFRKVNEELLVPRPEIVSATVIGSLDEIQTGSVLIRPGTPLPHGLDLPLRRVGNWSLLAGLEPSKLDRLIRAEGWHLFFVVPAVHASGLGVRQSNAFRKALAGVVRQAEGRNLNALEIVDIRVRRVLKLHYVRIAAHPRHIRDGPFLRDLDPYHRIEGAWDSLRLFDIRNRKVAQVKGI
jgi:hypothetical protein